ncbi:MAG: hypothetical protein HZA52_00315 [Planctomycetes bacterium]|nr:hypothetical protein [Planctomycetota bacterium]
MKNQQPTQSSHAAAPRRPPTGRKFAKNLIVALGILGSLISIWAFVDTKYEPDNVVVEFRADDRTPLPPHVLRLTDGRSVEVRDGVAVVPESYVDSEAVLFCCNASGNLCRESWRGILPTVSNGKVVIEVRRCCP